MSFLICTKVLCVLSVVLGRTSRHVYKPLCFSVQMTWRYYLFLATIIFSGSIPWFICLESGFLFARRETQVMNMKAGSKAH